jgi:hypothetical protein
MHRPMYLYRPIYRPCTAHLTHAPSVAQPRYASLPIYKIALYSQPRYASLAMPRFHSAAGLESLGSICSIASTRQPPPPPPPCCSRARSPALFPCARPPSVPHPAAAPLWPPCTGRRYPAAAVYYHGPARRTTTGPHACVRACGVGAVAALDCTEAALDVVEAALDGRELDASESRGSGRVGHAAPGATGAETRVTRATGAETRVTRVTRATGVTGVTGVETGAGDDA